MTAAVCVRRRRGLRTEDANLHTHTQMGISDGTPFKRVTTPREGLRNRLVSKVFVSPSAVIVCLENGFSRGGVLNYQLSTLDVSSDERERENVPLN